MNADGDVSSSEDSLLDSLSGSKWEMSTFGHWSQSPVKQAPLRKVFSHVNSSTIFFSSSGSFVGLLIFELSPLMKSFVLSHTSQVQDSWGMFWLHLISLCFLRKLYICLKVFFFFSNFATNDSAPSMLSLPFAVVNASLIVHKRYRTWSYLRLPSTLLI